MQAKKKRYARNLSLDLQKSGEGFEAAEIYSTRVELSILRTACTVPRDLNLFKTARLYASVVCLNTLW